MNKKNITIYYKENKFKFVKKGKAIDIVSAKDIIIKPKEIKIIPTNMIIDYFNLDKKEDVALLILPRSSFGIKKHGLLIDNSPGLIDPDYRGEEDEIGIIIYNTNLFKKIKISKNERIAQFMFVKTISDFKIKQKPNNKNKNKKRGGFGSTGGYKK